MSSFQGGATYAIPPDPLAEYTVHLGMLAASGIRALGDGCCSAPRRRILALLPDTDIGQCGSLDEFIVEGSDAVLCKYDTCGTVALRTRAGQHALVNKHKFGAFRIKHVIQVDAQTTLLLLA
jgi:hypothetical protein